MKRTLIALLLCGITHVAAAAEFALGSPDLPPNAPIANRFVYKGFGCQGDNRSPTLKWSGAPAGTKSFVVTVHDPDAPNGDAGWWHWAVYNIPAHVSELAQGATMPKGALQGTNDFETADYGGPCPPQGHGPHRYNFTLYALKVERLALGANATAAAINSAAKTHALAQTTLTARYERK